MCYLLVAMQPGISWKPYVDYIYTNKKFAKKAQRYYQAFADDKLAILQIDNRDLSDRTTLIY